MNLITLQCQRKPSAESSLYAEAQPDFAVCKGTTNPLTAQSHTDGKSHTIS
ncbi:MAG: hypothetical protein IKP16_00770 [Prevotella sp.]|nr:hypothetical protein [Prevotella sp.]